MNIQYNPYESCAGPFLKGQLHLHTLHSDGAETPRATAEDYQRLGYDFIVLTDHVFAPSEQDLACDTRMLVLPGVEFRGEGDTPEIGICGIREVPPRTADIDVYASAATASGGFCIFNHPTWHIHHWPIRHMLNTPHVHAMEIYNALVEWLPGAADCCDKWDRLLTCGRRIWGVATDDAHKSEHRNRGWVMLQSPREETAIIAALKAGRFYSSTGVSIRSIALRDGALHIDTVDGEELRFYADRGAMRHCAAGSSASYTIREDDIYVRAEIFGKGSARAWTNPVFVDSERSRKLSGEFNAWYRKQLRA